jgi:gamma-glutamyltranspeptidase/glutathione hydrolase
MRPVKQEAPFLGFKTPPVKAEQHQFMPRKNSVTSRAVSGTFSLLILVLALPLKAQDAATPPDRSRPLIQPVTGHGGMASTQEAHATRAAIAVLAEGGNAVDAAVTAGFTLAVTLPRAGNLGGGGFMLIHLAGEKRQVAIDYREKAPRKAHRDIFLNREGDPDPRLSRHTHLAAGVPGTVRGLALALKRYGTISLRRALQPAIELAGNGFLVGEDLHQSIHAYAGDFRQDPAARKIFLNPAGKAWPVGSRLIQKDLARSLRLLSEHGPEVFYLGELATAIANDMNARGGLITSGDLADYRPVERLPVTGRYRNWKVVSMPPPSSGGTHLIQMLNILEHFPISDYGHNSAKAIHVTAEAMRRAYADRSRYLGDPDFVKVPVKELVSRDYARRLARQIDHNSATPSTKVAPGLGPLPRPESNETTHFSVIDRNGNAVSNTYTLNFSYGSRIVVPGTGILLNNQMDDFSAKPGTPNAYGLIGGRQNAIEPGKRMLSSMTPTLLFSDDGTLVATGSPGGSRIINIVLQIVCNIVDHGMNVAEATHAPRFHHQWLPDELRIEHGMNDGQARLLSARGHRIRVAPDIGSTQTVMLRKGIFQGSSDPRIGGALTLGLSDNHTPATGPASEQKTGKHSAADPDPGKRTK